MCVPCPTLVVLPASRERASLQWRQPKSLTTVPCMAQVTDSIISTNMCLGPPSGPQGRRGEMVTSDHLWDMKDGSFSPYSQSMGMRPERLAVLHNIQLFLHSFGWLSNSFPQKRSGRNSFLRAKCLLKPKAISAYRDKWTPSQKFIIWVMLWLIWLTAVWFPREEKGRLTSPSSVKSDKSLCPFTRMPENLRKQHCLLKSKQTLNS